MHFTFTKNSDSKPRSQYLLTFTLFFSTSLFTSCATSNQEAGPVNLKEIPEACRSFDLSNDPEMAEACGVRQTRYKSYKNIPLQRYLILPKNANLTLTDKAVELRLENTLPVELPLQLKEKIDFNKEASLVQIKNKYIYKELYPTPQSRIQIFKMVIPTKTQEQLEYCFNVPENKIIDPKKKTFANNSLEMITCSHFESLLNSEIKSTARAEESKSNTNKKNILVKRKINQLEAAEFNLIDTTLTLLLDNTQPLFLPYALANQIEMTPSLNEIPIKNVIDSKEYTNENKQKVKSYKFLLQKEDGNFQFCFEQKTIKAKESKNRQPKQKQASLVPCADFDKLPYSK